MAFCRSRSVPVRHWNPVNLSTAPKSRRRLQMLSRTSRNLLSQPVSPRWGVENVQRPIVCHWPRSSADGNLPALQWRPNRRDFTVLVACNDAFVFATAGYRAFACMFEVDTRVPVPFAVSWPVVCSGERWLW